MHNISPKIVKLVRDPDLSSSAKVFALNVYLYEEAGEDPDKNKIMQDMGRRSEKNIYNYMRELKERNYLSTVKYNLCGKETYRLNLEEEEFEGKEEGEGHK